MNRIHFKKDKISIENIGKRRFWFGIFAGFFSAVSLSLFFNQSREAFRFLTSISADLLILDNDALTFFNYFFAALSTTLGLAITIWIWMSNQTQTRKKDRLYKQVARMNAIFTFWIILMMFTRFASILPIVLFGTPGYDNQLDFYYDYWLLFVLIPIFIFAQSWFSVRFVYRSGKWIIISFFVSVITAFTLSKTTTVDQEKLNKIYFKQYENEFEYIDKEISVAKERYGIEFDAQTIETLKKWHTDNAVAQVDKVKKAFAKKHEVSLDTIILQKMLIHNFKQGSIHYYRRNPLDKWHYALPNDVLKQIILNKKNANETRELFNVLKEEIDLVNTKRVGQRVYDDIFGFARRDKVKSRLVYNIPKILVDRLSNVRDSLMKMTEYSELNKILPEINVDVSGDEDR